MFTIIKEVYPIACNPKNLSSPIVTSASESNYNNPEGQIYVIVGTGGVNLQGLSGKTPYMASQQDSKFGVLVMRFSENKLNANFISNDGTVKSVQYHKKNISLNYHELSSNYIIRVK